VRESERFAIVGFGLWLCPAGAQTSAEEVRPDGILIHGDFGEPLETPVGVDGDGKDYFVENFPSQIYPMADNEEITYPMNFVAHYDSQSLFKYTNLTIDLSVHTVRKLDYGQIVESPPPELVKEWLSKIVVIPDDHPQLTKQLNDNQVQQAEIDNQLADIQNEFERKKDVIDDECDAKIKDLPNVFARQLREKQEAEKQSITAKAVAFNQSQADKGDAFGLQRMGERYRDGDGVPKDLVKAKDYLAKSAAAGSLDATNELSQLNSN
jgi:TPR repeat protein